MTGLDFKRNHKWLDIMPPFIAYGVGNGLHLPLIVGMEVVLIPAFDPNKFGDYLNKYRPNHVTGVPSHYEKIVASPKLRKKNLQYIISPIVGGDTINEELEKETNFFLGKQGCLSNVLKGYGMTEVTAAVSLCISDECNEMGSVGVPFSHTVISVFDPDNREELKYGEEGEICMRGPNTMLGYYNNPSATEEILRKHNDGNLWVHSGDIGYITEKGIVFIKGRIKRMITRHDGFKVFPSSIESVITRHSDVACCCTVGMPDADHRQGMVPVACIELKRNSQLDKSSLLREINDLCENELAEYARPAKYIIVDKVPLTLIGKVDYKKMEQIEV